MAREAKSIECKVLEVLHEQTYERGGGYQLRLVSWVVDGKEYKPSFEKREVWVDDSGHSKSGKAKGFSEFDVRQFIKHLPRICQIMGIPPAILAEELQASISAGPTPAGEPAKKEESAPWE